LHKLLKRFTRYIHDYLLQDFIPGSRIGERSSRKRYDLDWATAGGQLAFEDLQQRRQIVAGGVGRVAAQSAVDGAGGVIQQHAQRDGACARQVVRRDGPALERSIHVIIEINESLLNQ
jgi:hypothetical protein